MSYSQLTLEERYTISQLRMAGFGASRIGEILGRHRSTIHREIQRNSVLQCERWTYSPSKAQKKRNGRLKRSRRGRHHEAWQYARVDELLKQQWSPEQVADTLKKYGEFQISFQTIPPRPSRLAGGRQSVPGSAPPLQATEAALRPGTARPAAGETDDRRASRGG